MTSKLPVDTPFAASFPLPFRVLFLGGTGLLCWATNLHGLHLLGVDVASVLDIKSHDNYHHASSLPAPRLTVGYRSFLDPSTMYKPVYRLFGAYALLTFSGWAVFRYRTSTDLLLVDPYKYIPVVLALVLAMVLASPFNHFQKGERDLFLLATRRCLFSPANQAIYFSDVVLADIFTSFAKVIGDVWLSICMVLPGGSLLSFPEQDGWSRLMVPILMSVPYLIRLRQCLFEYWSSNNTSTRPLFNALKYASSFPVIFLSAAQRIVERDLVAERGEEVLKEPWHGEHALFRLWLLAVAINSLYSFWWDVTNDWGLELLRFSAANSRHRAASPPRPLLLPSMTNHNSNGHGHSRSPTKLNGYSPPNSSHPWGLRPTLLFPLPAYPLAVFFNLILRLTWSFKLSSHLHTHADGAIVIFWIEMAELLRRWVWVFFRVEWEVVRSAVDSRRYVQEAENFELAEEFEGRLHQNAEIEPRQMDSS